MLFPILRKPCTLEETINNENACKNLKDNACQVFELIKTIGIQIIQSLYMHLHYFFQHLLSLVIYIETSTCCKNFRNLGYDMVMAEDITGLLYI